MDGLVPWDEWCALIAPFWHPAEGRRRGRRPVPVETMLRPCLLQCWYDLSDVATEEAVYDSRAMSRFVGVDFSGGSQVPDSTTLREFRKCITDNGLGELMLGSLNAILEESGVMMRGGSIVDAAFVEAPSSTKNASGSRDNAAGRSLSWAGIFLHDEQRVAVPVEVVYGYAHAPADLDCGQVAGFD